jgi:hypothetical protein
MISFILIPVILIKTDTLTSYKCCKIKMHTNIWYKFLRLGVEGM